MWICKAIAVNAAMAFLCIVGAGHCPARPRSGKADGRVGDPPLQYRALRKMQEILKNPKY